MEAHEMRGMRVPPVTFKMRVRDESIGGDNPYRWEDLTTNQAFGNKKVLLFSLPGAFTPTCTELQLPGYEAMYDQFIAAGVDEIYCISVNDAFVMNKWAADLGITKVKMIPDGSARFTGGLNMTVYKDNYGMGKRSWRFAAMVVDQHITHWWSEAGKRDDYEFDPYEVTCPDVVYADLVGD
jgi:peroxiredoxin